MLSNSKETLINQPFFNSILKSILASLVTTAILIVAYAIPWLGWLVWIAFVPFILALRGRKRGQVYALTTIFVLLYLTFISYVTSLWLLIVLASLIVFIFLISEIQILSRRFSIWGWIVVALLWTIILFTFRLVAPSIADILSSLASIIPVSQPIFQFIAGTYGGYVLLLAVLLVNGYLAETLIRFNKKRKYVSVTLIVICSAMLGLLGGPITDLPSSTPKAQGMSSEVLIKMGKSISTSYPQIRSVVVVRHGYTVFEEYYQGFTPYSLSPICSDTKSFTGALVGIALKDGYIKSIDQKMLDFFPEYVTPNLDPEVKNITIKNLLTMTSGFNSNENYSNTALKYWYSSKDCNKSTLDLPIQFAPGVIFNYNSPAVHLLSGIINKTSNMKRSQFADRNLFGPLGIYRRIWSADPQGNNFGGAEMLLRSRDMAKFGYLYLKEGSWNGKQIIPAEWVKESTTVQSNGGRPHGEKYGYLFWVTTVDGHEAYFAGGFGGQFIYVIPDLDLVVTITSNLDMHRENGRNIVREYIIPSISQ